MGIANKYKFWLQFFSGLCLPWFGLSQQGQDSSRLLFKKMAYCYQFHQQGKGDKAVSCFLELNKEYPQEPKVLTRLARLYYEKKDFQNVLLFANQAIDINPTESLAPLTSLSNKMNAKGDYDLAIKIMNRLGVSKMDSANIQKVEQEKLKILLSTNKTINNVPGVVLRNLGEKINTPENEYLPTMSLDGQRLIFTRNVGGNEDFFISNLDSNLKWTTAQNMGYPPNTSMPDGAAMLSMDGNYLFYTRCDMRSPNGIEGGGCDLVFSFKKDSVWSSPQYFGYTLNTTAYEGQPCLSSDNQDLYFVSDRPGGFGGKDIWVSHFVNNYWSKPENVGATINTAKDETAPYIHPDNETLYFSSDGHPGMGKSDLFVSRRNNNKSWKPPINLGAPINTVGFDGSIYVNARGNYGYCASDRLDTRGGLDIYQFNTYPAIQPIATLCMQGYVLDKFYKNKIKLAEVNFKLLNPAKDLGTIESNAGDASYAKALTLNKTYVLSVLKEGYRPFYKKFTLMDTLPDNYNFNIRLRQPGLSDTLYKGLLMMDSTGLALDSISKVRLDSIYSQWPSWSEDSAIVTILLTANYYSGDSDTDTLFGIRIQQAENKLNLVEKYFEKRKLKCHQVMTNLDMIIYNDEEAIFNTLKMVVVESY